MTLHDPIDDRAALSFEAAPGLSVHGAFWSGHQGRRSTLLLLGQAPATASTIAAYRNAGWNVLWLEPRGAGGTEELKSPLTGDWTLLSLRALMVGKTPVGMRVDDAVSAMNWLAGRPDTGPISIMGVGALGPVALHAAVLDDRIQGVIVDSGLIAYREFVERPISINMAEVNLPGVLDRYDLPDLMAVLGDRLTLVNPANSIGQTLTAAQVAERAPSVRNVVIRSPRDPIALPRPSSVR